MRHFTRFKSFLVQQTKIAFLSEPIYLDWGLYNHMDAPSLPLTHLDGFQDFRVIDRCGPNCPITIYWWHPTNKFETIPTGLPVLQIFLLTV